MVTGKKIEFLYRWMRWIKRVFDWLIQHYAVSEDKSMQEWQVAILFLIFFNTTIFGFFACLAQALLIIQMGKPQLELSAFYFIVYSLILLVTFGRFIPFKTRAWIGTSLFYIIGAINLLKFGPTGSGRMYLFVFVIVICLTLGSRAAFLALLIDGVTLAVIGWLLHKRIIVWEYSTMINLRYWIATSITFLFLAIVVILPMSIIVNTRDKRLFSEIQLSENLRRMNRQYKQENIERKLVEKELKESEEKFLKVFQINPAAMAIISIEKRCLIDVNDTFKRMFGNNNGNYIGEFVDDLDIWVNKEQKRYIQRMIIREKPVRNYEISVYKADRNICRGLFSADIINLKGKKFLLAMMVDISENNGNLN